MKIKLVLLCFVMTLMSCSKNEDASCLSDDMVSVNVKLSGFTITQDTRTLGKKSDQYGDDALTAGVRFISFSVFDSQNKKRVDIVQSSSDTNFGVISFSITPGSYKILAVAHTGSKGEFVIESSTNVKYPADIFYETFCGSTDVELNSSSKDLELSLGRISSRLDIKSSESIPDEAKKLRLSVGDITKERYSSLFFNPSTGCMKDFGVDGYYTNTKTLNPALGVDMKFNLLLNKEQCTLPVLVEVLDDNDQVLYSHKLDEVSFRRSAITTATGTLFAGWKESVTFQTAWSEGTNITF